MWPYSVLESPITNTFLFGSGSVTGGGAADGSVGVSVAEAVGEVMGSVVVFLEVESVFEVGFVEAVVSNAEEEVFSIVSVVSAGPPDGEVVPDVPCVVVPSVSRVGV